MPARPEVDDARGLVGRVEVERELDAEHLGQAQRHVGVAREVEINLQRIAQAGGPRPPHLQIAGRGKTRIRIGRDAVGQQHLLGQADHEQHSAHRQVLGLEAVVRRVGKLRNHLLVVQDGAGDQMREEGDEEHIAQKAFFLDQTRAAIQQKADLREGEERDAQRQD
ncbi:hypothetical protein SDC9_71161 [bioreactor metagenome]|uniref:Uncharacterized protein n=1 Tax=bioreactor metagenome TaxID=1076179 RepID=A0A644Y933_9ZZZZ